MHPGSCRLSAFVSILAAASLATGAGACWQTLVNAWSPDQWTGDQLSVPAIFGTPCGSLDRSSSTAGSASAERTSADSSSPVAILLEPIPDGRIGRADAREPRRGPVDERPVGGAQVFDHIPIILKR